MPAPDKSRRIGPKWETKWPPFSGVSLSLSLYFFPLPPFSPPPPPPAIQSGPPPPPSPPPPPPSSPVPDVMCVHLPIKQPPPFCFGVTSLSRILYCGHRTNYKTKQKRKRNPIPFSKTKPELKQLLLCFVKYPMITKAAPVD